MKLYFKFIVYFFIYFQSINVIYAQEFRAFDTLYFSNKHIKPINDVIEYENSLYFTSRKGIFKYNSKNNKIEKIGLNLDSTSQVAIQMSVFEGKLYVLFLNKGVYCLDDEKNTLKSINNGLLDTIFLGLSVCNNKLYVLSYDGGIFEYNTLTNKWVLIGGGIINPLSCLCKEDSFWVAGLGNRLYVLTSKKDTFISLLNFKQYLSTTKSKSIFGIQSICGIDNHIFVSVLGIGIFHSSDNGINWREIGLNLYNFGYLKIIDDNTLVASSFNIGNENILLYDIKKNKMKTINLPIKGTPTIINQIGAKIYIGTNNGLYAIEKTKFLEYIELY